MNTNDSLRKTLEKCYIEVSETSDHSLRRDKLTVSDESDFSSNFNNKDDNYNPNLVFKKESSGLNSLNKKNPAKSSLKLNKNNIKIGKLQKENLSQIKNSDPHNENEGNFQTKINSHSELIKLKGDKLVLEEENALLRLEKEKMISIKDSQIASLNEKLSKLEIENQKLNEICDFTKRRLEESSPKAFKYDELWEKYTKLANESELKIQNEIAMSALVQSLRKEKEEIKSKLEIIRIENEALKNDKFYLSKESMTSTEKYQQSQDKIKQLEDDIRENRKVNQSYLDKLTEKNLNIETSFEERLRKETDIMRKKFEEDKENLKKLFEELAEKRCLYLNEEREDYKFKTIKLEKSLKDKEETIDFLNSELRTLSKKYDEESAFLRIQLKIKSEELVRLTNIYEENNNLLKLHKIDSETLKDKNDLLRSELIRKEADFKTEITEVKSQMIMLKEKLVGYEAVEDELDKVILDSAVLMKEENEVMNIIKDIPTSSKRRISQCLVLANKLKLSIIEIEKLKDLNKRLEDQISIISEEKELFKNISEKVKQPQSYLIKNLQDMEVQLWKKDKLLEEKEQSIKSLLRENELISEKITAMESDMKLLLNNRKKLDNLEDIIGHFINKNEMDNRTNFKSFNPLMSTQNQTFVNSKNNSAGNIMIHVNNDSVQEAPERDINSGQSKLTSIPKWYKNLKSKKN